MILPTKHITCNNSLIGVGAIILNDINKPISVVKLWEKLKNDKSIGTYERFVLALDLLFIIGAITLSKGLIRKSNNAS